MGYAARAARERAHGLQVRKLFVGTPMYEGLCHGQFALASIELSRLCAKRGVEVNFCFSEGESLITRARNYLVDDFLASGATHLLFLDADLGFDPDDVLTLPALDKPIIGAPCPKKTIAWDQDRAAEGAGIRTAIRGRECCGRRGGEAIGRRCGALSRRSCSISVVRCTCSPRQLVLRDRHDTRCCRHGDACEVLRVGTLLTALTRSSPRTSCDTWWR
jgi:hypothetical protein